MSNEQVHEELLMALRREDRTDALYWSKELLRSGCTNEEQDLDCRFALALYTTGLQRSKLKRLITGVLCLQATLYGHGWEGTLYGSRVERVRKYLRSRLLNVPHHREVKVG